VLMFPILAATDLLLNRTRFSTTNHADHSSHTNS
jgi:hypothetical protein